MTYDELNHHSLAVAQNLLSLDVRSGSVVALCFEKSPWMVVSMLAVLRAGAAFVPLSPTAPAARQQFILDDV